MNNSTLRDCDIDDALDERAIETEMFQQLVTRLRDETASRFQSFIEDQKRILQAEINAMADNLANGTLQQHPDYDPELPLLNDQIDDIFEPVLTKLLKLDQIILETEGDAISGALEIQSVY